MRMIITGGSGRLGQELRQLLPELSAPTHAELDLTAPEQLRAYLARHQPRLIIHAAAYTDVKGAESNREACWQVNVEGSRNIARAARALGAKLIHISTDYVFSGDRGHYAESDAPGPVSNYYALTKLLAEEAVRQADDLLIIRTSFRPRAFPYPVAFEDVFTSQDYVDVIAPLIAEAVQHVSSIPDQLLHIATERKSVYELARRRHPQVRPGKRTEAGVQLPADVSLDTRRWQALRAKWTRQAELLAQTSPA